MERVCYVSQLLKKYRFFIGDSHHVIIQLHQTNCHFGDICSYSRSAAFKFKSIFVPKVAINNDSDVDQSLDPLAALTLYISSNDEERLKLKDVANSTIQLLQTVSEKSRSTIF